MSSERTLTARGAARRSALLDAAADIVAGSGSGALTCRAVASTAAVSLASVTYHFASIEDLRRSMSERAVQLVGDELARTVADRPSGELPGLVADGVVALLAEHRSSVAVVQQTLLAAAHDSSARAVAHSFQQRVAALLAPAVGGGERGAAVAAALQGLVLAALADPGLAPDRLHASVLDLVDHMREERAPTRAERVPPS
ncbi:TetR family transcriptional regulator [Streptomyces olivaceus]|uniref:TetR/AcrR family transcriptional regulator n=1 Tax=Streptomyces olivaceus TaxID=47716 RepID=UPI0033210123